MCQNKKSSIFFIVNPLTPNDPYRGRTAPLTSKRCSLYIYSTNIGTEYFKHGIYSPFLSSSKCNLFHNSNVFGSCIIRILYTGCAKINKIFPALNPRDPYNNWICVSKQDVQLNKDRPTDVTCFIFCSTFFEC